MKIKTSIDWDDCDFAIESHKCLPLWEDSVRPINLNDVKGHESAKTSLLEWIQNPTKPLLLAGPSGCGKTSLARAFFKSKNFTIWDETMCGDDSLHDSLTNILQRNSLLGSKRAALIECAEGLTSEERTKLLKLFEKNLTIPILITCDNLFDKSLKSLKNKCICITLKHLNESLSKSLLISCAQKLGKSLAEASAEVLLEASHYNIRHALNSMQFMMLTKNRQKKGATVINDTDISWDIFSTTSKICNGILDKGAEDIASSDLDLAITSLQHNLILSSESLIKTSKTMDILSISDIHLKRYENEFACFLSLKSVSSACKKGYASPRTQFPLYYGKLSSKTSKNKNLRIAASGFIKKDEFQHLKDNTCLWQLKPSSFESLDYMSLRSLLLRGNPKDLKKKQLWIDIPAVMDILRKGLWEF